MHEAIMANPYETHITAAGKTLMQFQAENLKKKSLNQELLACA